MILLRIAKQPKDFFVGCFLLKYLYYLFVRFNISFDLAIYPPELAIGVMIIAAAPGGATSNIITSFAKGDVALSVSLTAIISLLSVITIQSIVLISLNFFVGSYLQDISISIFDIAIKMFLIVTIPVIIGHVM